jgi:hypothetical protein
MNTGCNAWSFARQKVNPFIQIKIRTMGTIKQGVLGAFSGKVGTVIGSTWKGIAVMRGLPVGRRGNPTPSQIQQKAKFGLMIKFLQPLTSLLNLTFDSLAVGMSGINKAFSYNLQNALTGVYPALAVNYPMVLLSRGDLPVAGAHAAASTVAGKIAFNWTDNSGLGKALTTDIAFVAVFCEALNHWVYNQNTAVTRDAGTYTLDASTFSGKTVQTYIGFVSANGKTYSNTVYTGVVNVL